MKESSVVGDLINFRGLVYSPMNENGVIFLFGKVLEDLNMYIEEIKPGFPDCTGRRFNGKGWEKIYIEFEYLSSNFKLHKHDPKKCDMIVCWEHDWPECNLEVIELKDVIKGLPNVHIKRPDLSKEGEDDDEQFVDPVKNYNYGNEKIKTLMIKIDEGIKKINDHIWTKPIHKGFSYYSPKRVFLYANWYNPDKIRFELFTGKSGIKGVENRSTVYTKWGIFELENEEQIPELLEAAKISFQRIQTAIKNNEPTTTKSI
ncbi:MAG: hypothetical protein GYA51_11835 [Candidatus Methanofastidiosa archaeon]|jgi:hypothetical protein|nr:hypothetical protein [Candidatus Methanofastidiosa archaeon]